MAPHSLRSTFLFTLFVFTLLCNADCISNPLDENCKDYKMPDDLINGHINSLCGMMGEMPGCSVHNTCNDPKSENQYPGFCKPFAVYKMLCLDMPGMKGCKNYTSMCRTSSVVEQCTTSVINHLPTFNNVTHYVKSMCDTHSMPDCSYCDSMDTCDKLMQYSRLCISMPGMPDCHAWDEMCTEIGKWSYCSSSAVPSMIMYFHTGINEYFLFKEIIPTNEGQYTILLIIIFVLCIVFELFKLIRFKIEQGWKCEDRKVIQSEILYPSNFASSWNFKRACIRAIIHFFEVTLSSALMLIIMTFNVGIFITYVLGRTTGQFIIGDRMKSDVEDSQQSAECH